jgi:hypothetical protein
MASQEEKRNRFKKLAVYRTNEVLKRLKVLSNCANRSAYDYTEEEINKIFNAVEKEVKEVKAKFHFPKHREFKL